MRAFVISFVEARGAMLCCLLQQKLLLLFSRRFATRLPVTLNATLRLSRDFCTFLL